MEEYTYGITRKGNHAIRTPSPVQGLTVGPGELTPVLGLASDCSTQSDCQGCLEDSIRVHRPGNWTGGEKRRSYPRVRGNDAASVTLASSSRPLPVTCLSLRGGECILHLYHCVARQLYCCWEEGFAEGGRGSTEDHGEQASHHHRPLYSTM